MFPLLAQLVAPPIQPGPARLPERESPARNNDAVQLELDQEPSQQVEGEFDAQGDGQPIELEGSLPYSKERIQEILQGCAISIDSNQKNSCISQLNAQLQQDGYINTRVVSEEENGQTKIIVIPGRLVEINVRSKSEGLSKEIENELNPLLDQVFNIIQIKNALLNLERLRNRQQHFRKHWKTRK